MQEVHLQGYNVIKNKYKTDEMKIISYDIWHMEIIELTCIIKVALRDFYANLIYFKYKNYGSSYINDIIEKTTNNDFMNIEKANMHYKKGLNINLKDLISESS